MGGKDLSHKVQLSLGIHLNAWELRRLIPYLAIAEISHIRDRATVMHRRHMDAERAKQSKRLVGQQEKVDSTPKALN
jgi:hypothetical protein